MSDTRTVREVIARAIADTGEDPENALVEADAVLAALTDQGIVLARWVDDIDPRHDPTSGLIATGLMLVSLIDDEIR